MTKKPDYFSSGGEISPLAWPIDPKMKLIQIRHAAQMLHAEFFRKLLSTNPYRFDAKPD